MENQVEVEDKCILPVVVANVEVELEALQAHPDQVVEVKPKSQAKISKQTNSSSRR